MRRLRAGADLSLDKQRMPAKTLTYVDSNVLIYAISHRNKDVRYRALMLLGDKRREFLASEFLRLETLPYAIRSRNRSEIAFFERFFDHVVKHWVDDERDLFEPASKLIQRYDLQMVDALHLAAAIMY